MKSRFQKYQKILFLAAGALTVIVFFSYKTKNHPAPQEQSTQIEPASSLAEMARQVVAKCSSAAYKPGCYEQEVPRLMEKISMKDAFVVTHFVQQDDPSYTYCHVLGHKLSANQVAKDPSKWLDVVNMCPSGECSNGCIHGAFQEKFRAESLSKEQLPAFLEQIDNICEPRPGWQPTGLEQGTCYHALGHLLMYVSSADITASLAMCDKVAVKDNGRQNHSPLCYDGAFMQIYQPLETEDFALVEGKQPTKAQLISYCSRFSGQEALSCWSEGWPLYRAEIMTPTGVVGFCRHFKSASDQSSCYTDLFYVVTAQVQFDTNFMKDYCSQLPAGVSGRCFANTASRLIETDYANIEKSAAVCKSAGRSDDQDQCFNELVFYSTFNFKPGSEQFYQLCNSLPGGWKNRCLANSSK